MEKHLDVVEEFKAKEYQSLFAVDTRGGAARVVECRPARRKPDDLLALVGDADLLLPGVALFGVDHDGDARLLGYAEVAAERKGEARLACSNCGLRFVHEEGLDELEDASQRVWPGEVMPYGECPACGSSVHRAEDPNAAAAMIVVKGGVVQGVVAGVPMRVMIKDLDVEGLVEKGVVKDPDGNECSCVLVEAEVDPGALLENSRAVFGG